MQIFPLGLIVVLIAATSTRAQHEHAYAPPPEIPKSWAQHLWFEEGPFVKPYNMGWGKEIAFPITTSRADTQAFFQQGWALLAAGWQDEAIRSFRHALYEDPPCAMALWALSMASLSDTEKARTFLQEIPAKAKLSKLEASFLEPLQDILGPNQSKLDWRALAETFAKIDHPEAGVAALWVYRCHPDIADAVQMESWAKNILTKRDKHPIRAYLVNQPRWHTLVTESQEVPLPERLARASRFVRIGKLSDALACYGRAIPELAEYATLHRQLPSRSPRYVQALAESVRLLAKLGHGGEALRVREHLQGLPRHPSAPFLDEALRESATITLTASAAPTETTAWVHALESPGWPSLTWELPTSTGKPVSTTDFINRDVLVIFYLGKGCVHCLEQLQAFSPLSAAYQKSNIAIVAISLDSIEGLKATLKLADEPFPFPLVSDEKLAIFRAYDAFDSFDRSPIHGTFFVSKSGMVKWADVGHEPFMDAAWLLEECQRLQKLDKTLPTIDY